MSTPVCVLHDAPRTNHSPCSPSNYCAVTMCLDLQLLLLHIHVGHLFFISAAFLLPLAPRGRFFSPRSPGRGGRISWRGEFKFRALSPPPPSQFAPKLKLKKAATAFARCFCARRCAIPTATAAAPLIAPTLCGPPPGLPIPRAMTLDTPTTSVPLSMLLSTNTRSSLPPFEPPPHPPITLAPAALPPAVRATSFALFLVPSSLLLSSSPAPPSAALAQHSVLC
jgi:hypothetical protein